MTINRSYNPTRHYDLFNYFGKMQMSSCMFGKRMERTLRREEQTANLNNKLL